MPTDKKQNLRTDGIHGMVPRELQAPGARKIRDIHALMPDAPFHMQEFGYFSMDEWERQGKLPQGTDIDKLFGFDPEGKYSLGRLGWCEAEFEPCFEEKILEDRGDYELIQDFAGRAKLCFKGRRRGFMPDYIDHPVKDIRSWEENCVWRLDTKTPERNRKLDEGMETAVEKARQGLMITQNLSGGYMYLRSLIGPEALLYKFYDDPELIHACMKKWLELSDYVIARHQEKVTIDEIFFAEDICYNSGPLISPEMVKEFLFPYYQQVIANLRKRQIDKARHLYIQVDTDGKSPSVIDLYMQGIGMDSMSPFEVASGCDVVEIRKKYPRLVMRGGFDKRILAKGKEAIDREVDRIFPFMKKHGGYIPTCDHGVPPEVVFEDYVHFRKRCLEFA
jgi:hypothetical protein